MRLACPLLLLVCSWYTTVALAQSSDAASATPPDSTPGAVAAPDRWQRFYDDPASLYGSQVLYQVLRNNKIIGEHTLGFQKSKNTLLVTVKSELAVRYLGIPVYRYNYRVAETWIDGELDSVVTEIKDNRKDLRVIVAEASGRVLKISDRGTSRLAPLVKFATTYWHPGGLEVGRVFHTTHGRVHNMTVQDLGQEKLSLPGAGSETGGVAGRVVDARHYRISGGFRADLWYDREGRGLALQFKADDGSRIDYKCLSCNF